MSKTIEKILVPIDFSEVSIKALEYAAEIAKNVDAKITLLHVFESYAYNAAIGEAESTDIMAKGIEDKLNKLVEEKSLGEVEVDTLQKKGKIYQEIDGLAEKENIDLIVMGTHGATGLSDVRKFVLGTNAYRVVLSSPCPVITIKGQKPPRFDSILLPLDVTKSTRQKVDLAMEWAKMFGAKIHLVSVSRFIDEFVVSIDKLKMQLREVAQRIRDEGIECTTKMIRHTNIAESVVDHADEMDASLIMIMTQQERKWNEFILGSSARTIITDAERPVMSLRPKESDKNSE